MGPYQVQRQYKYDVRCFHLADTTIIKEFFVGEISLWTGTKQEALEAAQWDFDVYKVHRDLAHRGNIYLKTHMEFLLEFVDGEKLWIPFGKRADLIDSTLEALQIYCVHTPELYTFCMNDRVARAYIRENTYRMDDTDVKYNEVFYLDIRYYPWVKEGKDRNTWFDDLDLPDKNVTTYVTKCIYGNRVNNDKQVQVKDTILGD